ncbi:hypothetical protein ACQR3P_28725 [Rhodococcus sp. IEGM1300]
MPKEYAVYKGEKLLIMGTARECAKVLGVLPETVYYYTTDAYQRKLQKRGNPQNVRIAVCLDDEE